MVSLNGKGSLHHLANARVAFFSHSATLGDAPSFNCRKLLTYL